MADNSTLFQVSVLPELFGDGHRAFGPSGDDIQEEVAARRLRSLETIEGLALERQAAGALAAMEGITWSMSGAWRNWKASMVEIDVMARRGEFRDPDARLLMAGCKRNPDRHSPAALDAAFSSFIEVVDSDKAGKQR